MAVILFDLDGTLLPMDQNQFVRTYFGLLGKKVAAYGYDPQAVISALGQGTYAILCHDKKRWLRDQRNTFLADF